MDTSLAVISHHEVLLPSMIVSLIAFTLGGLVKGAMGLGMPVTVVSIMCLTTDIRTSAMLVLVPVLVTNLWQCIKSRVWFAVYRQYWRLTLSMSVILLFTSVCAVDFSQQFVTVVVGFVLLLFAVVNLWLKSARINNRFDRGAQYVAGISTGVLGGLSGLVVVPLAIYFTARDLDKEVFVASTAPFFLLGAGLLTVGYSASGLLTLVLSLQSSFLVLPALAGLVVGERVRPLISDRMFRTMLLLVFIAMGINLIQRGIAG